MGRRCYACISIPTYPSSTAPRDSKTSVQDKCHQLRASILSLNAKISFILGQECSFDEGGIANKSCYNPVRQYNAPKPDKYRIDFFVLVNASKCKNFIYHMDIYRGKMQIMHPASSAHVLSRGTQSFAESCVVTVSLLVLAFRANLTAYSVQPTILVDVSCAYRWLCRFCHLGFHCL